MSFLSLSVKKLLAILVRKHFYSSLLFHGKRDFHKKISGERVIKNYQSIINKRFFFCLPSFYPFPVDSDPVLLRNSKNYFFFPSLFAFSDFSLYQADVSFGSIHSSSLSSLSLSESDISMATRRARIEATS